MILDFFLHALIAGVMLSFVTAPLGCFVVWRRMSYFGDAVAHSALLGVVLGVSADIPVLAGIVPVAILMALLLTKMQNRSRFSVDTLLGILAHCSLALGVVLLALSPNIAVDINGYLFGDILAVSSDDLMLMYLLAAGILMLLWLRWKNLLLITINEDMARVQGIDIEKHRLLLMLMIAVTVALSIKLVGLLLITSMLILPAATARFYSRSPQQMMVNALILSLLTVVSGLYTSYMIDAPTGPAMVLMAGLLFLLSYLKQNLQLNRAG